MLEVAKKKKKEVATFPAFSLPSINPFNWRSNTLLLNESMVSYKKKPVEVLNTHTHIYKPVQGFFFGMH